MCLINFVVCFVLGRMQYLLLCLPGQITAPKDFLDSATKLNPELMGVEDIQAEPADATNPLTMSQGDKATPKPVSLEPWNVFISI